MSSLVATHTRASLSHSATTRYGFLSLSLLLYPGNDVESCHLINLLTIAADPAAHGEFLEGGA
jgi:hypothetical protein